MDRIAVLFTGQGSEHIAMRCDGCQHQICMKETFEEANEAIGFNLSDFIFYGNLEQLAQTQYAQPAILAYSVALFRFYLKEIGINPICSAGHSLGELSALTCAGVIRFPDAIKLAHARGKFIQEALSSDTGGMSTVIGLPADLVETGARAVPLKAGAPFHSPLMRPASLKFKEELLKYEYRDPRWTVYSNLDACPYRGREDVVANLTLQIASPVLWHQTMEILINQKPCTIIGLGPDTDLKLLVKAADKSLVFYSWDIEADLKECVKAYKSGITCIHAGFIDWCLALAVSTPNMNDNIEEYWKAFVDNYKKLQKIQSDLEKKNGCIPQETVSNALYALKVIFDIKKLPAIEQSKHFYRISHVYGIKNL